MFLKEKKNYTSFIYFPYLCRKKEAIILESNNIWGLLRMVIYN